MRFRFFSRPISPVVENRIQKNSIEQAIKCFLDRNDLTELEERQILLIKNRFSEVSLNKNESEKEQGIKLFKEEVLKLAGEYDSLRKTEPGFLKFITGLIFIWTITFLPLLIFYVKWVVPFDSKNPVSIFSLSGLQLVALPLGFGLITFVLSLLSPQNKIRKKISWFKRDNSQIWNSLGMGMIFILIGLYGLVLFWESNSIQFELAPFLFLLIYILGHIFLFELFGFFDFGLKKNIYKKSEKKKWKHSIPPNLSEYFARIKEISIELHDYAFFHSPTGIDKQDQRFLGRKTIKEKLTTILTNSETKSGTYLVTGFRGMGKTSLVRKALAEIQGTSYLWIKNYLRIILELLFLGLFSFGIKALMIIGSIGLTACVYLVRQDRSRPNLGQFYEGKSVWQRPLDWLVSISRIFNPFQYALRTTNTLILLRDLVILSTIILIQRLPHAHGDSVSYGETISEYFILLLIIFLVFSCVEVRRLWKRRYQNTWESGREDVSWIYLIVLNIRGFISNLVKKFNTSQRLYLEMSLAQDDLHEKEILKILAKTIYFKYRRFRRFFFSPYRILSSATLGLVIIFFSSCIYYNPGVYGILNEVRERYDVAYFFPSQALFPMEDRDKLDSTLVHIFTQQAKQKAKQESDSVKQDFIVDIFKRVYPASARDSLNQIPTSRQYYDLIQHLADVPDTLAEAKADSALYCAPTSYIDMLVFILYQDFRIILKNNIPEQIRSFNKPTSILNDSFLFSDNLCWIPPGPDYFYFIYLLFNFFLVRWVIGFSYLISIPNHRYISRRLKRLNENIVAEIRLENQRSIGGPKSKVGFLQAFSFWNRKTRTYPIANIQEIETELIEIFKEIDRIPRILGRPEFIIIFDELDKIESGYNVSIVDKASEDLGLRDDADYYTTGRVRRRREAISNFLSNLKRFFSTARAKFIFIAGREMYDAALADISDREAFISSIFHDVIYVHSFFKDPENKKLTDITGLTEQYVCQLLLPQNCAYHHDLQGYNQYLKETIFTDHSNPHEAHLNTLKRHKILYVLRHFISYLAYRSNGAPKKITKLLEDQIRGIPFTHLQNSTHLVAGRNFYNLYINFSYNDQYKYGFTYELMQPFLTASSRHLRAYSDKFLISISFLIDHLYKFHNSGFSWQSLEQTPELISINKAPGFRKYIADLLSYLGNSHLEEIVNGLFQFKFISKITNEIDFVSKISELEAAAFNFTLDESLQLKRHYKRKLNQLIKDYGGSVVKSDFIQSVSYLYLLLGDLHFYDKEYEDSIIQYMEACQVINKMSNAELSIQNYILMLKFQLKIGLTYEKMKDYDMAFMAFGRVTKLNRDFAKKYSLANSNLPPDTQNESYVADSEEKLQIRQNLFESLRLVYQPLIARLYIMEKMSLTGITASNIYRANTEFLQLINELALNEKYLIVTEYFLKLGNLLYFKNGRLIEGEYTLTGLLDENGGNTSLAIMKLALPQESHAIIHEILMVLEQEIKTLPSMNRDFHIPVSAYTYYMKCLIIYGEAILPNLNKNEIQNIRDMTGEPKRKYLYILSQLYFKRERLNFSKSQLIAMANILSNVGNTLLAMASGNPKEGNQPQQDTLPVDLDFERLTNLFNNKHREQSYMDDWFLMLQSGPLSNLTLALSYYYLAGLFYARAEKYHKYGFQLRKILYLIHAYFKYHFPGEKSEAHLQAKFDQIFAYRLSSQNAHSETSSQSRDFFDTLEVHITRQIFSIIDRSGDHIKRLSLREWDSIFEVLELSAWDQYEKKLVQTDENRLTFIEDRLNHPVFKETIIIHNELKLLRDKYSPKETRYLPKGYIYKPLIHPYSISNQKYVRIMALRYRVQRNEQLMIPVDQDSLEYFYAHARPNSFIFETNDHHTAQEKSNILECNQRIERMCFAFDEDNPSLNQIYDWMAFLIADSLFCLLDIIKTSNIFGFSYMINHSGLAIAHQKMGEWAFCYERFIFHKGKERVNHQLDQLIQPSDYRHLDVGYHYNKAIQHYYRSMEMHKNGHTYHEAILNNQYYLDDGFHDNLYHFCAAYERYRINTGYVRSQIKVIRDRMDKFVDIYDYGDLMSPPQES